jgi:hypothetical protein
MAPRRALESGTLLQEIHGKPPELFEGCAAQKQFAVPRRPEGNVVFEGAMTSPRASRQRLIEDRVRAVHVACARLGFGKRNLEEPVEGQDVERPAQAARANPAVLQRLYRIIAPCVTDRVETV